MINTIPQARLQGRIALITGGARGQGASHALRLGQEGAAVYIPDVLDEDGETEAKRLREEGLDVTYLHLDVTNEQEWRSVMDALRARGGLDVLVNNAGVIHAATIEDEPRSR